MLILLLSLCLPFECIFCVADHTPIPINKFISYVFPDNLVLFSHSNLQVCFAMKFSIELFLFVSFCFLWGLPVVFLEPTAASVVRIPPPDTVPGFEPGWDVQAKYISFPV